MTTTQITWKPVAGFERFYSVSDAGQVLSVRRNRVLRPGLNTNGYFVVGLCVNGKSVTRTVHSIVLEAFVGARPVGYDACHRNSNKTDNRLENLRWDTHAANIGDSIRDKRNAFGERSGQSVLTESDVRSIRSEYRPWNRKYSISALAAKYSVSTATIHHVITGRNWSHVA